ncbi:hypothetical protein [Bradyrhizobium sp. AUGA SZCCT0431]|uniref:hypothetical protein n=1 Tax=Bradyrhizobium sp. AUGA SZCCT0431 TaxID=2807674 RepID=UPI001BAAD28D|nr:hypothetical protein [Bradyrhizobium sp. AUGA SZCCT0431]MBR1143867.1 hypothetical protein [Bradyrhizobium sp. AUGA SZCCT0431]
MQLIDQKLKGFFDIEVSQLWDEALIETMRAKEWLNVADFDKGLEVARKRFPAGGATSPPAAATPAQPAALAAVPEAQPVSPLTSVASAPPVVAAPVITSIKPVRKTPAPAQIAKPAELLPQEAEMIEPAKSAPEKFQMRFLGYGKLIRPWRVRMKQ